MTRFDEWLLGVLNGPGRPSWLDAVMLLASSRVLLICCAAAAAFVVSRRTYRRWVGAALLVASVCLPEAIGAYGIKPAVDRSRPCASNARVVAIDGCDASGSMPSDHAAITAAMVVVSWWAEPAAGAAAIVFALVVGASRIYLGLHYPSDVLAGYGLGAALAVPLVLVAARSGQLSRKGRAM